MIPKVFRHESEKLMEGRCFLSLYLYIPPFSPIESLKWYGKSLNGVGGKILRERGSKWKTGRMSIWRPLDGFVIFHDYEIVVNA